MYREIANNGTHRAFMMQALSIAFRRMGRTSPNPPVGAVIVSKGKVAATGGTMPCGSNHAEVCAIEAAGSQSRGSELYVTIEPCCHYGKTPPCTEAIISAGIQRVYIPMLDPNPLVSGKGVTSLKNAGIDVVLMHDMGPYAADLYRPFKKCILRKKPFVISKSAMTLDGRIATVTGDSRWITGPHSRYIVHKLRAKVDAIIVGKNTFLKDNPALTVRFDEFSDEVKEFFINQDVPLIGRDNFMLQSLFREEIGEYGDPCRILMGLPDSIDPESPFFADGNYIIFEKEQTIDRIISMKTGAATLDANRIVPLEGNSRKHDIEQVMDELHRRGFMMVLLEGGAAVTGSFFNSGAIDQFLYFYAPRLASDGISAIAGAGFERMDQALRLHDITYAVVKDEFIVNGYREVFNFEIM